MPQTIQQDLHDEFLRALAGLCPLERVREIEARDGGPDAERLAARVWQDIDALGYVDALTPADLGGAGLSLADAEGLLRAAGASALPYPLADTMLARALLRSAGQAVPDGPIALALARPGPSGLRCVQTPGAGLARSVLVQRDGCLLLVAAPAAPDPGLFRPRVSAAPAWPESPPVIGRVTLPDDAVQAWRNAADAACIAGAMQAVLDRCIAFVGERQQFGRALGRFQAIQQEISVLAEQVASTAMAARLACASGALFPDVSLAACARLRACEAIPLVCAIAHAIHGAIGITEELALGIYTTRLHEWRATGMSEDDCAGLIGRRLLAGDSQTLLGFVRGIMDAAPAGSDAKASCVAA
ncbi:acyl-CoA dehydrogenase [Achromobacter sp. RTa]|uniref:acyl-CoA dehydrogenase n=1 Tax=Achromobacter sp. RTa TaxID=1532557 RepID=UPI000691E485|nr:acyl-CoA dehydrogenase [Achromobacter sp. RTa]